MEYQDWLTAVPENLKRDPLWQFHIYPKTLFLYDLLWDDCAQLVKEVRGRAIAEQVIRSGGSICANIEEGFGRGFGAEFAYFLRVALGSARETRGWGITAPASCFSRNCCSIAWDCSTKSSERLSMR